MSTYIFLRHGHSAANATGLLTGQLAGIGLSREGVLQANSLIERIGAKRVDLLHISPIERCQLTIDPWLRSARSRSLEKMTIDDGFSEINFGKWSGKKLQTLRRDPLWKSVQQEPSRVTFPEGESFKKAQKRAVESFQRIRDMRGEKTHLIVSHSDTIKLVVADSLGMHLDEFQRLSINPASFTIFSGKKTNLSLVTMNNMSSLKEILG